MLPAGQCFLHFRMFCEAMDIGTTAEASRVYQNLSHGESGMGGASYRRTFKLTECGTLPSSDTLRECDMLASRLTRAYDDGGVG